MKFYNPYHFVPVKKENRTAGDHIQTEPGQPLFKTTDLGNLDASRYHRSTYSGRLLCTLETKTPAVFGGIQETNEEGYTVVKPFEREKRPAIPATTLKGCVSGVAEAASNSALRVLENRSYSRRVDIRQDVLKAPEDYSALGMIREINGKLKLSPLAIPTLIKGKNKTTFTLSPKFREMFSEPVLKAYCFENVRKQETFPTYDHEGILVYYAKLKGKLEAAENDGEYSADNNCNIKSKEKIDIMLGAEMVGNPLTRNEFDTVEDPENYTKGILRSFYTRNRYSEIPRTKKHEIFIPLTLFEKGETFEIMPEALKNFHRMAKEKEAENNRIAAQTKKKDELDEKFLPFCLKGDTPFKKRDYKLQDCDIVFFTPDNSGTKIQEISVSQLWRKPYPDTSKSFFEEIDPESLPFNSKRTTITPAEAIFGFIEEDDDSTDDKQAVHRAMAGRVRFYDGMIIKHPDKGPYHDQITLRILDNPKPPCPSFYFKKKEIDGQKNISTTDCYIAKNSLCRQKHIPQGRKFYLNHKKNSDDMQFIKNKIETQNKEERKQQKNQVTPLKSGCVFTFHIDFDNLSRNEIGLLMYSLSPPYDFLHKMGMGKALGLGSVKLGIAGLCLINRKDRYTLKGFSESDSLAPRYHKIWLSRDSEGNFNKYHDLIARRPEFIMKEDDDDQPLKMINSYAANVDSDIKNALEKLGKPYDWVLPPLRSTQYKAADPINEQKTYEWFQQNDTDQSQGLVPLSTAKSICMLDQN